jgi:IS1 family transposase
MKTISFEKRALILSLVSEGMPISGVCRILHVGKHAVLRLIKETGAALAGYMNKNFRNVQVDRLAMDEQWQYVGKHGQRMMKKEADRGDFWLWAGIDSDTKLIVGFHIGRRVLDAGEQLSGILPDSSGNRRDAYWPHSRDGCATSQRHAHPNPP